MISSLNNFKLWLETKTDKSWVSPSGSPIKWYFKTSQGSQYIMSAAGETRRIKSSHLNTGGEDAGLHGWYPSCVFVSESFKNEVLAAQHLLDKGFSYSLTNVKGEPNTMVWIVVDPKTNQWRPATWNDAYPKTFTYGIHDPSIKPQTELKFKYVQEPKLNYMTFEIKKKSSGVVKSSHPGSPVSEIHEISKLKHEELQQLRKDFGDQQANDENAAEQTDKIESYAKLLKGKGYQVGPINQEGSRQLFYVGPTANGAKGYKVYYDPAKGSWFYVNRLEGKPLPMDSSIKLSSLLGAPTGAPPLG